MTTPIFSKVEDSTKVIAQAVTSKTAKNTQQLPQQTGLSNGVKFTNLDFEDTTNESSDGKVNLFPCFIIDEIERLQDLLHLIPTQPTILEIGPSLEKIKARNQIYFEIDARVGIRGEKTNWMFTCLFDRKNSRFYVWLSQAMSIDKLSKSSLLNIVSFAQKMLNANSLIFILPRDHPQKCILKEFL